MNLYAVTLEQVLSGSELKRVIFHQQDAQIVFDHIIHAFSIEQSRRDCSVGNADKSISSLDRSCRGFPLTLSALAVFGGHQPLRGA